MKGFIMKKLFLILFLVIFSFNANAIVVVPTAKSTPKSSTKVEEISTIDQSIIGKDFHGCKVVAVRITNDYFTIICYKDGNLYKGGYRIQPIGKMLCPGMKSFSTDCQNWSQDIPLLFKE